MQETDTLKCQIAISLLPKVGLSRAKKLIEFFGGAEAFFAASEQELQTIPNLHRDVLPALLNGRKEALQKAEKELDFIGAHQIQTFYYQDDNYPYRLKECPDAPILLYGRGNLQPNGGHALAVVGTRTPSERGKELCRQMVLDLASKVEELTIISGLAYGIDITAHRAALEAGIPTLIIPGHGLDRIYPAVHRNTAVEALKNGGIMTEYQSGVGPEQTNFVARNRIIAGMSDATLVIESKEKGGSLITAQMALSYGRDVLAVPGRVNDELSKGCNNLIKRNQAALVECADDVLLAMQWDANKAPQPIQTALFDDLSEPENLLLRLLKQDEEGLHVNQLVMESKLAYGEVSALLLQLEFKGWVKALPGGMYLALR